jgi:hypothetical protein
MCEPSGDNAFGYHYVFNTNSGNQMYYAVIGALTDTCLQESCPDDNNCTPHLSQSQLDRITQAASHELAEMMTDPQPPTGWYPEIGDPCSSDSATITVGSNSLERATDLQRGRRHRYGGSNTCVGSQPRRYRRR